MAECEYCGQTVEEPAHQVVNNRIFLNDAQCCQECGFDDDELLEWVEEYQPGQYDYVESQLEDDDE